MTEQPDAQTVVAEAAQPDLHEILVREIHNASEPLTANQLRSAGAVKGVAGLSAAKIEQILEEEAAAGRIYKFCPARGAASRYWDRDHEEYARRMIEKMITGKPKTKSNIEHAVKSQKRLQDCPVKRCMELADELVREGIAQETTNLRGKTKFIAIAPVDAEFFVPPQVVDLLAKLTKNSEKLESLGVTVDQVVSAAREKLAGRSADDSPSASESDRDELILQRIIELEPAPRVNGFVSLPELRQSLDFHFTNKESFDRAVLKLAAQDKVKLHKVEDASSLGQDEHQTMVADEKHNLFDGLTSTHAQYTKPAASTTEVSPAPVSAEHLEHEIFETFLELRREHHSYTRAVPIHEIRQAIRERFGADAASHQQFDAAVHQLRLQGKVRLYALSDLTQGTQQQLNDSIPGVHETLFFVEEADE